MALKDEFKTFIMKGNVIDLAVAVVVGGAFGKIVKLLVQVGDAVQEGQTLLVMEAMKMQNELKTNTTGTVTTIHVQEGATVETGSILITVVAPDA